MNQDFYSLKVLALGGAALASAAFYLYSREEVVKTPCTKEQLLMFLEDMSIQYTPYYNHYFNLLTAVEQEYRDKPVM